MDIKQFQGMMDMVLKNKEGKALSRSEGEAVLKGLASVTITWLGGQVSGKILANNVELNDTWAFYQAKSIKQNLYFVNMEDIRAQLEDPTTPPNVRKILTERADRYQGVVDRLESDPKGDGKQQIMAKARALESERDLLKKRSPFFGMASTILQIAIVLSTTAILAVSMALWYSSIGVGIIGLIILADGMWYFFPLPF